MFDFAVSSHFLYLPWKWTIKWVVFAFLRPSNKLYLCTGMGKVQQLVSQLQHPTRANQTCTTSDLAQETVCFHVVRVDSSTSDSISWSLFNLKCLQGNYICEQDRARFRYWRHRHWRSHPPPERDAWLAVRWHDETLRTCKQPSTNIIESHGSKVLTFHAPAPSQCERSHTRKGELILVYIQDHSHV